MNNADPVSRSKRINFYINLAIIVPFIVVILSGLVLQIEYHMNRLPADTFILGLDRSQWLLTHKVFAVMALAGAIAHCALHWNYIAAITRKRQYMKISTSMVSYYLFAVSVPTILTALASWIFFAAESHARFMLVEMHDKLALILVILISAHLVMRLGWMVKTWRKIAKERYS